MNPRIMKRLKTGLYFCVWGAIIGGICGWTALNAAGEYAMQVDHPKVIGVSALVFGVPMGISGYLLKPRREEEVLD